MHVLIKTIASPIHYDHQVHKIGLYTLVMFSDDGDRPAQLAICSGVRHNLSVSSTLQEPMIERAAKNKTMACQGVTKAQSKQKQKH